MKNPTDIQGVPYTKSLTFEALQSAFKLGLDDGNNLGLNYDKLDKINVQGVVVYTVKKDEIKEWSNSAFSVTFSNGKGQKVAEILVHYAEEILIHDNGLIRVQRQK